MAVEAGSRDKGQISNLIRTELLNVSTEKPPHKKVNASRKSVVYDFNLARDPNPPRFEIEVKDRYDELKPSRPYPPATPVTPPSATGKYYLATVTFQIPIGKAPEKATEAPKEAGK